jgi:hypothetical protein
VEEDPEYPGNGDWGMPTFEVGAGGAPVAVIRPADGDPWLLSTKFDSVGTLYATPNPDLVCVMDRLREPAMVDVVDPAKQFSLDIAPVRAAAAIDEQLLLFADWQTVTAWGVDGIRWVSEPIFEYDLHIGRTDNGRIVCTGANYAATARWEVTLDAATGRVIPSNR